VGDKHPRYACRGGMSTLGRHLTGEDKSFVLRETRVNAVEQDGNF
jgi:hypothetical protein